MVCYYVLKIIKEFGLLIFKKVCFVVGIDEEFGWGDMDYYFEYVGFLKFDFGFFLDVEFLIINGEKGNIIEYLYFLGENKGVVRLYSFFGGFCENMVLELVIVCFISYLDQIIFGVSLVDFVSKYNLKVELFVEDGQYIVIVYGKFVYGLIL